MNEYLSGSGNFSSGRIIPIKRNQQFQLWIFFSFQMAFSLLAYLATFSGQLYFLRSFFIDTSLTTLTQQLLYRSNYFFRAAAFFKELLFRKSHFLAAVIFSEYLIFRNETCTEQPLCENKKRFRAVNFRNSYFFGGVIAQNKYIYRKVPLIEAGLSARHQPTFPGELPFLSSHFFKIRYLLQQQLFQKSYFLTTYSFRRVAISQLLSIATLIVGVLRAGNLEIATVG